jgi:hypothetical protein
MVCVEHKTVETPLHPDIQVHPVSLVQPICVVLVSHDGVEPLQSIAVES